MNDRRSLNVQRAFLCQHPSHPVARINHTIVPAKLNKYFYISPHMTLRCLMPCSAVCLTTFLAVYDKHFSGLETDVIKFETTKLLLVEVSC